MDPLQVDGGNNEPTAPLPSPSIGRATARYVVLSFVVLAATLTCPGTTTLRPNNEQWNLYLLMELLIGYVGLLLAFYAVVGSDPGYLTCESMQQWDDSVALINDNHHALARRKVCDECGFAPPLRSHHCRTCRRCVATFDHHCDFLRTCIGERNHGRFYLFLTLQAWAFWLCCAVVNSSSLGLTSWLRSMAVEESARVVLTKLYLYPLSASAWTVWAVHTFLILANLTTFELAKGPRHIDYLEGTELCDCPFSGGVFGNVQQWLRRHAACGHPALSAWTPVAWPQPDPSQRPNNTCWKNQYWSCC